MGEMAAGGMSRGDLLLLALVLAVGGAVNAAYLTWQWFAEAGSSWCDVGTYFSCSRVRDSAFSSVAGIPTATVGLVGFAVLAGLALVDLQGRARIGSFRTDSLLLAFAVAGALIGVGLSVIEVAVIGAVCLLCALGFALDVGILAIAIVLFRGRREGAIGSPSQG
jgi:uncharacterized membrane protein